MTKKQKSEVENEGNGKGNQAELNALVQTMLAQQVVLKELTERLEDIEKGKDNGTSAALLRMVNFMYDTDDAHIPELTRIPIQAARPLAYAMGLDSLLHRKTQKDGKSLSERIRLHYYRLMRSVGGVHLGRGVRLAEEQAAAAAEEAEETDLGGE